MVQLKGAAVPIPITTMTGDLGSGAVFHPDHYISLASGGEYLLHISEIHASVNKGDLPKGVSFERVRHGALLLSGELNNGKAPSAVEGAGRGGLPMVMWDGVAIGNDQDQHSLGLIHPMFEGQLPLR